MAFISSDRRQRAKIFDDLVERTASVLITPAVAQRLGSLGSDLAAANQQQFLPNIRHGLVYVPRSKRAEEGSALLPYLSGESRQLHLSVSMFMPTPRVLARAVEANTGLSDPRLTIRHHAIQRAHSRTPSVSLRPGEVSHTWSAQSDRALGRYGIFYNARPLTVVAAEIQDGTDIDLASVCVHALSHVNDFINATEGNNGTRSEVFAAHAESLLQEGYEVVNTGA